MQIPLHLIFGPLAALAGGAVIMLWRVHETRRPVTRRSIMLPPVAMSTDFMMFLLPAARIPWTWGAGGFLFGALVLSAPLASTSKLERQGDVIMLRRSRVFLAILLVLVGLRLALRSWIDDVISPVQTGALFFVSAFGMIVVWRARMLRDYTRLQRAAGGTRSNHGCWWRDRHSGLRPQGARKAESPEA